MLRRLGKSIWALLALLGLLFVIVTATPIDVYLINMLTGPIIDPRGDVLIVLGAEAFPDAIGYESYLRAVYGVRVWRQGGFRQVLISGGPGPNGMPAALPMRDFMVALGVPVAAITVETTSLSTHENALHCKELLQNTPGHMVLLTSDFHTFRAWRSFRKAGLNVESCSFPDFYKQVGVRWTRWNLFLSMMREFVAIGYYKVRGWI